MSIPASSDPETDEDLLTLISKGDAHAFTQLFRRHQGQIYRFALHMTGLPAPADDVTQDVFMIVMREAASYRRGESGVMAWLCGIARNCARQRLHRDRRFEPLEPLEQIGRMRRPRRAGSSRSILSATSRGPKASRRSGGQS